ncbi:MAG: histidinol-phosphate transaminase [Clostridia bacterium]|nr:histidinol-phosphate transaminase [Clostridia bacterium]MBQ6893713.1 histidinol-phosphate transaminase [Clostridia bacterium]
MSRFFSDKYKTLTPYTPGEQPRDQKYIKLNTNESPFPPSPKAVAMTAEAAKNLQLYPDPECTELHEKLAALYGVDKSMVLAGNGSDEVLNFAFMAYCDKEHPARFANITYGFYSVFAEINGVPYTEVPLKDDFTIDVCDYISKNETIFIANPNAPTGIALTSLEIEAIVKSNPDNVVVIDEAYVDFGAESAVPLIKKYDNLLVTQTFSKSRSMAGARLGVAIGNAALIQDLNTIKYSTNPYNINRMTMAAGIGVLADEEYTKNNCNSIIENREYAMSRMRKMGFEMTPSLTNFIFAKHDNISGGDLYSELRKRGILVRHFSKPRLDAYNRITVGSMEQMVTLCDTLEEILKEI